MDKIKAGARRARFLEIERLYRTGLSQAEVGRRLDPPITAQRVGALLREGAKLGVYVMPVIHRTREQAILSGTEDARVLELLRRTSDRRLAARALGFSLAALEQRFGHVIRQARRDRIRQRIVDDYLELAARLGYAPSSTRMGANLARRVSDQFSSFEVFYRAAGVRPVDRRRRGKGA